MIKQEILTLLCAVTMVLGGCAQSTQEQDRTEQSGVIESEQVPEFPISSVQPTEITSPEPTTEQSIEEKNEPMTETDEEIYIGEYLDSDVNEPNLEIAKGDDGKYIVQIGIFRLTSLDDGIGELTTEGLTFTATDSAGNPISGVITVEGQIATVTFTNSTWGYLPNGTAFQYMKSSDIPNIWGQ